MVAMAGKASPPQYRTPTGRNGGDREYRNPPVAFSVLGQERSSPAEREHTIAKDVTAAATALKASDDAAVDTPPVDAADSGLPDPARCVRLGGSRSNRSAAATTPRQPRTTRSSRDVHTSEGKNRQILTLGAGPRAPRGPPEPEERTPPREPKGRVTPENVPAPPVLP